MRPIVTTEHRGHQTTTIGGLLVFGKDRFSRFPDAWIQPGRFAGSNRARLLDSVEIRSYLPRAAEEAIAFARKHLIHESIIERVRREDRWSVPLVAILEALMNAIVHADYAQQSAPIRLVFSMTVSRSRIPVCCIRRGVSKLRNRVIGRVFHELHVIEPVGRWDSTDDLCLPVGWPGCSKAGRNRNALSRDHFQCAGWPPNTDETDRRILAFFGDGGARSTAAVAKHVGLSQRATLTRLKSMTERGLLAELGTGPHDPKRRYLLT